MGDKEKKRRYEPFCCRCGVELNDENCRSSNKYWSLKGNAPYCIDCEEDYYAELAKCEGKSIALFHACIAFNVPCRPIVLSKVLDDFDSYKEPWREYIYRLAEYNEKYSNQDVESFFDGQTDILKIFGKNFTQKDFAEYIKYESSKIKQLPGTQIQRNKWGYSGDETDEYYNRLDTKYKNQIEAFKGQTITPKMEMTLITTSILYVKMEDAIKGNHFKVAKDIQAIISNMLSDEQMRKKDEKPVEKFEIDSQIDALEKAGLVEDGKFLSFEKMRAKLVDTHFRKKKYSYPVDAVDQLMMNIHNNIRINADLAIDTELPEEMEVEDTYEEFAKEENEIYKDNKKFAGLTPVQFTKKNDK